MFTVKSVNRGSYAKNVFTLVGWMGIFAILGVLLGAQIPLISLGVVGSIAFMIVMILLSMFALSAASSAGSNPTGYTLLMVAGFLLGVMTGPVIGVIAMKTNGLRIIWLAVGITFAVISGITTYAWTAKKDFSFMGGFLAAALIAVIFAGVLNMFLHIQILQVILAVVGVLLFSAYLLMDVSNTLNSKGGNEVEAAANIFLDIWNLFLNIVQIVDIFD